jgi:hypothetical protein
VRFAKIVFVIAGIWGIAVLTPFYWLVDVTGRHYQPPTEYPHFFYGFFSVAMAWQFAFLVIGSNPGRFRPLMLPSMLEKFGHVMTVALLHGKARISSADAREQYRICCWASSLSWRLRRRGPEEAGLF